MRSLLQLLLRGGQLLIGELQMFGVDKGYGADGDFLVHEPHVAMALARHATAIVDVGPRPGTAIPSAEIARHLTQAAQLGVDGVALPGSVMAIHAGHVQFPSVEIRLPGGVIRLHDVARSTKLRLARLVFRCHEQ